MASLPKTVDSSAVEPSKAHEYLVNRLERGETPPEIAKRLAKGDKKKAQALRRKIWRMVRNDPIMQKAIVERAQAQSLAGMPAAMSAASKRAARGRMDAVKFLGEASGIHNPRVKHEHSGNIKITLDMPRPTFGSVDDDGTVVDE